MPATYQLIASNTLSSSAASVTFSSIPATYTDLVLKYTFRGGNATNGPINQLVRFNGSSATNYSLTNLVGLSTSPLSTRESNESRFLTFAVGNSSTSNTFSSNEVYIPNYTGSANKVASQFDAAENNSSTAFEWGVGVRAYLRSVTDAITSITIDGNGNNIVAGSSFFLYGIKSS